MATASEWFKVTAGIRKNRKIKYLLRAMGPSAGWMWLELLCMARECNDGGSVYLVEGIGYGLEELAEELDLPPDEVQQGLELMQKLHMLDVDPGGVIQIEGWGEYQNIEGMEAAKEKNRQRQAKFREKVKQKMVGSSTTCAYCGGAANSIDHVIPLTAGGQDTPDNTVPACLACNMGKTNHDVARFLNRRLQENMPVDIDGVLNNPVLSQHVVFDRNANRFALRNEKITLRNATERETEIEKETEPEGEKRVYGDASAPKPPSDTRKPDPKETRASPKSTKPVGTRAFVPPSREEVLAYCQERNNRVNVDKWFSHYESNGWRVGKNRMQDWRAAIRTWEHSDFGDGKAVNSGGTAEKHSGGSGYQSASLGVSL